MVSRLLIFPMLNWNSSGGSSRWLLKKPSQFFESLFVILVDVVVKSSSKTMYNCGEIYSVLISRTRAILPVFKAPLLEWYFWIFTSDVASFAVAISLEYLFEYPNPGLNGIILYMSLGNTLWCLLDSIWHINWCGAWIRTWQLLWHFNWVPSLLFSWLVTWHTNWHADRTFTWQLSGQVSWVISRIAFVSLCYSPLESLFESYSWSNLIQLILYIPLGSKVRYPDLVGSPLRATLAVPPSGSGLRFPSLPPGAYTGSPS